MKGVITMRAKDLDRIKVIERLARKELTQIEAGKLLDISDRQVRTLLRRYQKLGDKGLISRKLGNNHRALSQHLKDEALKLIKSKYPDFGPTLATEKLQKNHNILISVETVRQYIFKIKNLDTTKKTLKHLRSMFKAFYIYLSVKVRTKCLSFLPALR